MPPQELEFLSQGKEKALIEPFFKKSVRGKFTFGLSECGYDVCIDQNVTLYPITLKNIILKALGYKRPSFLLASTKEKFNVPDDMAFLILDKSSWARRGLAVQNTIAEPNWSGYLTLELSNHGEEKIVITEGTPIAQVVFFKLSARTHFPYNGKYQNQQRGPQQARG